MGRDGSAHKVCDALVGDETGVVYLTLWDDNITKVNEGDTIRVENGYVTLFKGNMRLNIVNMVNSSPLKHHFSGEVNTENNVSSKTYEQEQTIPTWWRTRILAATSAAAETDVAAASAAAGDRRGGGFGGGRDRY